MPEEFTNREIGIMLKDFCESNTKEHLQIMEQVKYTNGRVKRLEKISYVMQGALWVLGVIVGSFIFPIVVGYILKVT